MIPVLDKMTRPVQNGLVPEDEWFALGNKLFGEVWAGDQAPRAARENRKRRIFIVSDIGRLSDSP